MKKIAAVVSILCCGSFLYGMEPDELTVVINGTTISVVQGNPYKPERDNATVTIVGYYQQDALHEPSLCDPGAYGDVYKPPYGKYVYIRRDKQMADLKSLGKKTVDEPPYPNPGVDCIAWKNTLLCVVEPVISKVDEDDGWTYEGVRRIDAKKTEQLDYTGKEALINAKFDLATCYRKILETSYKIFSDNISNQQKNLILPSISTSTLSKFNKMPYKDAASIACLKIMGFVVQEENKNVYNLIQFIVGPNDFPWYYKYFKRFNDLNTDSAALKDASYYDGILRQIEQDGEAAVK